MSGERLRTKIANVTLQLPVYRDKRATEALAQEVGELVASMESEADRIDSQAFALLAAYEFARRLKVLEDENESDLKELLKALDGVATNLSGLVGRASNAE